MCDVCGCTPCKCGRNIVKGVRVAEILTRAVHAALWRNKALFPVPGEYQVNFFPPLPPIKNPTFLGWVDGIFFSDPSFFHHATQRVPDFKSQNLL